MLENIKTDIEKLIALYEGQKAENVKLSAKLQESETKCKAYQEKIEELENQIDNLTLQRAFLSDAGNNSVAKDKIARLIKEIDKCITLLEN